MILAALLSQTLDLLTYRPAFEVNPVTLALGPYAIPVKLLLLVVIAAGYLAYRARWNPVLAVAVVAGCVGTLTNVL